MPDPDSYNSKASSVIRVAIVADQPEIREGLELIINGADGYQCMCSYGAMAPALAQLQELSAVEPGALPDVVLIDLDLPDLSGGEVIRRLNERYPQMSLLALAAFDDNPCILEALSAGVSGYLLKTTPPQRLLEGLREVVAGGAPMSPEVARRLVNLVRSIHQSAQTPAQDGYGLTSHEKRILKLLVEGHNYKTAAAELGVSVNTVSFHVRRIYEKLDVHSKSQAVAMALQDNLV